MMHARMLVTFTKEKARTSQGARKYAYTVNFDIKLWIFG